MVRRNRPKVYAAWSLGLCLAGLILGAPPVWAQKPTARHYDVSDGLANNYVAVIHQDAKGYLWFGTREGLCRFDGYSFTTYGIRDGLRHLNVTTIVEDRAGRLWVGTYGGGVARLLDDPKEGPAHPSGEPMPLDRKRFLSLPVGTSPESNRVGAALVDTNDRLWCVTEAGLYATVSGAAGDLRFETVIPHAPVKGPMAALADPQGRLWFALGKELIRMANGQITRYGPEDAVGRHEIVSIAEDRHGRVLVANRRALFEWAAPADPQDRGQWQKRSPTLSPTPEISAMIADSTGALWIGGKGLIQYPAGQYIPYRAEPDLIHKTVVALYEDQEGNLWIGTPDGVSRWAGAATARTDPAPAGPGPDEARVARRPPRIYLSRIQVAGKDQVLPERGAQEGPELTLGTAENDLRIQYVGLSFQSEGGIRYQHWLKGAETDWSPPSEQRWVHYAGLPPGSYQLLVRAVNPDGLASPTPAVLRFHIESPDWQQWWFRLLTMIAMVACAVALYHIRVRRIVASERVRQQIATDLHDDIGSGLSQIAILSEVAKREAAPPVTEWLDEMAKLARAMRESMSDIVWAVDPRKDRVADLVQRMRQAAYNSLEAEGLTVEFHAPDDPTISHVGLEPDRRRHVLLFFKEVITNIARHAAARHVRVKILLKKGELELAIQDDGRGFDPQAHYDGHGLQSLRQRAQELRARLDITSAPGHGATVRMRLPLEKSRR